MPTPAPVPQPRPLNAFGFSAALFWPQVFGGKSEKKEQEAKGATLHWRLGLATTTEASGQK